MAAAHTAAQARWAAKTVDERAAIARARRATAVERNAVYRQLVEMLRAWAVQQPGIAGHAGKQILVDQLCVAYLGQLCIQNRVSRMGATSGRRDWSEWTRRANEVLKRLVALGLDAPGLPGMREATRNHRGEP